MMKKKGQRVRDYQRSKDQKYILPRTLYNKILWIIRDYDRTQDTLKDLIYPATDPRQPTAHTNKISRAVESAAIKRETLLREINAIDRALQTIPEEYRSGIWNNIQKSMPYPIYADRSTYGRWKSKFIYETAKNLELI